MKSCAARATPGADDLFTPEINNVSNPTGTSVAATDAYDQIKVEAILNEIDGKTQTDPAQRQCRPFSA
jgi:hypothetical protein